MFLAIICGALGWMVGRTVAEIVIILIDYWSAWKEQDNG